jgi:hypothetical protein
MLKNGRFLDGADFASRRQPGVDSQVQIPIIRDLSVVPAPVRAAKALPRLSLLTATGRVARSACRVFGAVIVRSNLACASRGSALSI